MEIYDLCLADFERLPGESYDSPRIKRAIAECGNGFYNQHTVWIKRYQ